MAEIKTTFLNTGIYTVPEASRLTQVSVGRIRRWLRGYNFYSNKKSRHSPAIWHGQFQPIDNSWALGFLDLIEIKCVDSFIKAGVGWTTVRKAHYIGSEMYDETHPFCTNRFATDGRQIFSKLHDTTGEPGILEIATKQIVFSNIVAPFFKELEFNPGDVLARWRPLTTKRLVVLDPARSFGHPIVAQYGVPTEVLAKAAAKSSITEVSRWYELPQDEIEDAIEFEKKLAA